MKISLHLSAHRVVVDLDLDTAGEYVEPIAQQQPEKVRVGTVTLSLEMNSVAAERAQLQRDQHSLKAERRKMSEQGDACLTLVRHLYIQLQQSEKERRQLR